MFGGVSWQRTAKWRLDMAVRLKSGLGGEDVAGMKTQSDSQHWYVLLEGQRHGPFSYAELTKAAREGFITAETNIWRSGWKNWHLAKSVKGLVEQRAPSPPPRANERPVNEAPLAPDDIAWADDQVAPEEVYQYAPPQHREARRSQEMVALRFNQKPVEDKTEHIFADEWRMLAERPAEQRGKAAVPARIMRKPAPAADFDDVGYDDLEYRSAFRGAAADRTPFAGWLGNFVKRAAIAVGAVLLLAGGGVVVFESGALHLGKSRSARHAMVASAGDLPTAVATLPAVVALQHNDPVAFEHFKKRYAASAVNARDDQIMTLARNALRKSVKHLLAISSGDVLIEITQASLAYLKGLQASNPESCVALSDESKGARLTSNLYKELPGPFAREMSVLEKIANTNPHTAIAPMSAQEARPYFDKVAATLARESVKTDLQGLDHLDPSEFAPYCALVIAFYQAVLDLPQDDKVNLLRYLYATAAVNADSDLKR